MTLEAIVASLRSSLLRASVRHVDAHVAGVGAATASAGERA